MNPNTYTLDEFLRLPAQKVHELVYPEEISISLLLNGTRRWYLATHLDTPPTDSSYFHDYLVEVLKRLAHLLNLLAKHGLYRVFMPVYSPIQTSRNATAHEVLLKGIQALVAHPYLLKVYEHGGYGVNFYGDTSFLPEEVQSSIRQGQGMSFDEPKRFLYYDANSGNPHDYIFKLAFEFGMKYGRPPVWAEMVELYYGNRAIEPLDILVAFNSTYSREGIPPLLGGKDRIYTTAVSPLVLSETSLRTILYDYLYNRQDKGRDYADVHPNELHRLKHFYEANKDTVMGVMKKFEDLYYPMPSVNWPAEMDGVAVAAASA